MEDVPMYMMGLLGCAYIVCSVAESVLSLIDRCRPVPGPPGKAEGIGPRTRASSAPAGDRGPETVRGSGAAETRGPGILIAAGHRPYQGLLARWFREHGFAVWVAADGHEAVETYRANRQDIAVAILDLRLPGLDGPEVMAALRQEAPSLPCCLMAANLVDGQKEELLALGAAGVLEKPLLLPESAAVIRILLAGG